MESIFKYIKSAFWGVFAKCGSEINSVKMEYLGEKTRNSLYMGFSLFIKNRHDRSANREDYKLLKYFKKGFNKPMPGVEE